MRLRDAITPLDWAETSARDACVDFSQILGSTSTEAEIVRIHAAVTPVIACLQEIQRRAEVRLAHFDQRSAS